MLRKLPKYFSVRVKKKKKIEKKKKKINDIKFTQSAERQSSLKKERVAPRKQYGGRR